MRLMRLPETQAKSRLFGTDGVRGTANVWPMTAEVAMQLGRALAYLIRNGNHRHRVVIGKDTRLSGYMLEQALAAGITSMGVDVELVGPAAHARASRTSPPRCAPTPGAVISASHNPYQDNGIKFFWRDGFKLPDETEAKLEELRVQRARSTTSAPPRTRSAAPSASTTPGAATSSSSRTPSPAS